MNASLFKFSIPRMQVEVQVNEKSYLQFNDK